MSNKIKSLEDRLRELSPRQRTLLARRLSELSQESNGHAARQQQLVAYFIPDEVSPPNTEAVSQFLGERLPDYMIPTTFIPLEQFPRTPNGKIDRARLPAPESVRKPFVPPSTPTQEKLARVWADVLRVERVGANDTFIQLGGHSLVATQVMSRLLDTFSVKLPMSSLFGSSTLEELAAKIDEARQQSDAPHVPSLLNVERPARVPLSFAQQGLWFMDQLEPDNPIYNVHSSVQLTGTLDAELFGRSLAEIVRRHEILRTCFPTESGSPAQLVLSASNVALPIIDLTSASPESRMDRLRMMAREESRRPFDLAGGPMLRVVLFRLGDDQHVLSLTMHHIIADMWSAGLLLRELGETYAALKSNSSPELPDLPIQYADYAIWQRGWLKDELLEQQLDFWKQQLADVPPLVALPTDFPRPAELTYRGERVAFELPESLEHRLRKLGTEHHSTLFMTLLTAFHVLLHRFSGQTDLCIAAPAANRNRSELEPLIGYFLNTIIIRCDASDHPNFAQLLERVRDASFAAFDHQDVPAERVLEALHLPRNLSQSPLTQIGFALQNAPLGDLSLTGLQLDLLDIHPGTTKCDLALLVWESPTGLSGTVEYNTDLFEPETINRLITAYQTILETAVTDPLQPIAAFPLSPVDESGASADSKTPASQRLPPQLPIAQQFEQQTERHPDAIAVECDNISMTYRELNTQANQLARELRELGVGPDRLVGVCLPRSVSLVVAILGVMKAGGAYVPLDPDAPAERLAGMLADVELSLVVSESQLNHLLPTDVHRVCLDQNVDTRSARDGSNVSLNVTSRNRLYAIFTSGSTGRPKLAAVTHGGFSNLLAWFCRDFEYGPDERTLLVTSPNFDLTQKNFFAPLVTGGRLHLIPAGPYDPELLSELIQRHQITRLNTTPSGFYPLIEIDTANWQRLSSVRFLFLGGEPISVRRLADWLRSQDCRAELVNTYGPTECTDICCAFLLERAKVDFYLDRSIPIGRPIPGAQVFVVSPHLQLLPIGALGELCIAGLGVGEGYLNDHGLTATRFVAHPFAKSPGERLYRTGDLVRWRSDGTLEFVGRTDHQVKVRGHRIELGEIETTLSSHPAIQAAVVLTRDDAHGNTQLVAYIIREQDIVELAATDLRIFLKSRLPDYMIPAGWLFLEEFPLTPNGKLDRKGLPSPDTAEIASAHEYLAPRDNRETQLAEILQSVLGVEKIGVHENFFELGGDSILAIQAIAKAREVGMHLAARHLFQYQTIAELAQVVEMAVPIHAEQGPVEGPVPLTPIQRQFFTEVPLDPHHFNQSVLLEVRRPLDFDRLRAAISHLIAHHDVLRMRYHSTPEGWKQINGGPGESLVERVFSTSELPGAEQEKASQLQERLAEIQGSLDLSAGPIWRVVYFPNVSESSGRLLIVAHHLVIDGVSWRILLEDLLAAYLQLEQGRNIALAPKTTSLKYWADRLPEVIQQSQLREDIEYWLQHGPYVAQPIPLEFPQGENTQASAELVQVDLSEEETQELLQQVPQVYHTRIDEVLLTAVMLGYRGWSGDDSLLLAIEGHGREDIFPEIDLSRTVGWFTTLSPVELTLSDNSVHVALTSLKEQLRAVPGHGFAFGLFQTYADPEVAAPLLETPRPAVSFNYLGQFDQLLPDDASFALAPESPGPLVSPRQLRSTILDIISNLTEGRLHLSVVYSRGQFSKTRIEDLTGRIVQALRDIITHCRTDDAGGYTPSDFPDADLDQDELTDLLAELRDSMGGDLEG